jgi:S-adenosylmethionine-diacylglycerol 3-amino-3-carboxypropyl transferase
MTNSYFMSNKLNYTYVNEDHVVEHKLLETGTVHAVAVAGSGTRLVPLLARNPRKLTLIDISQEQVWFSQFRLATLRSFERDRYLAFWGYAGAAGVTATDRKRLFEEVRGCEPDALAFVRAVQEEHGWGPLLGVGLWEKTFKRVAKRVRMVVGADTIDAIFSYRDNASYQRYLVEEFPWFRWKVLTAIYANSSFFNAVLYGSQFPKMNLADGYMNYYNEALRKTLSCCPARENFFLQLLMLGKVAYPEALGLDVQPDLFAAAKCAASEVVIKQGNLLEDGASASMTATFFAVSDVPSYFKDETARQWLQMLRGSVAPGGMLVARYYRHKPVGSDYTGWSDLTAEHAAVCDEEKTHMYRYDILRRSE